MWPILKRLFAFIILCVAFALLCVFFMFALRCLLCATSVQTLCFILSRPFLLVESVSTPSKGCTSASLGRFGPSLGRFGPSLGRFGPLLGPSSPSWTENLAQRKGGCPYVSSFGFSKTKKVPHQGKEEARNSRFRSLTISWSSVQTDTLL